MGLALLGDGADVFSAADLGENSVDALLGERSVGGDGGEKAPPQLLFGTLSKNRLATGGQAQLTFLVAWCFPNRPKNGNFYATRFPDAAAVADYVAENFERLAGQTRLWHGTWYDSTLPHWLLDRLFSTARILATSTCQWWANGRFWAWEGAAAARARAAMSGTTRTPWPGSSPDLERRSAKCRTTIRKPDSMRDTGEIHFRGEDMQLWAGDSQGGYPLKVLPRAPDVGRRRVPQAPLAARSASRSSSSSTRTATTTA